MIFEVLSQIHFGGLSEKSQLCALEFLNNLCTRRVHATKGESGGLSLALPYLLVWCRCRPYIRNFLIQSMREIVSIDVSLVRRCYPASPCFGHNLKEGGANLGSNR